MLAPSLGCSPTIWTAGLASLRKREVPMMVPVVPIEATKCVTLPRDVTYVRFCRYRFKFPSHLVWDLIKPISNIAFNFSKTLF